MHEIAVTQTPRRQPCGERTELWQCHHHNGVSPGPVWTPLTVSALLADDVPQFGTGTLIGRAAQPFELAPAYVYLASDDSRWVTGQVVHVNGGITVASGAESGGGGQLIDHEELAAYVTARRSRRDDQGPTPPPVQGSSILLIFVRPASLQNRRLDCLDTGNGQMARINPA